MHSYQLEDKTMDEDFLAGKPVCCRAIVPETGTPVQMGDFILVVLSTGRKYKGTVKKFDSFRIKDYEVGELVIARVG